jgi:benzylsuccinate CoA-transferase BbsF subunit
VMARSGNRSEYAAPHGIYPCRDEADDASWIAIAVLDDVAWQALVDTMGRPVWARDTGLAKAAGRLAAVDELDQRLAEWTAQQSAEPLAAALQATGVEAGVVCDMARLVDDPQLSFRSHFVSIRHEALGTLLFERSGFRLSGTPGGLTAPGPLLGEHNHEILSNILGLPDAEIDRLVRDEVTV